MTEISGTVMLNGEPLANATVIAINDTQERIEGIDTTESDGTYNIPVAEGNTYHIKTQYDETTKFQSKPFIEVDE